MKHCSHIGLATTQHDSALAIVESARRLVFADAPEHSIQSKRSVGVVLDQLLRNAQLVEEFCASDDMSWRRSCGARP